MFSCLVFFYVIKTRYTVSFRDLINQQPRFAIMMCSMFISIVFSFTDALVSAVPALSQTNGVNPYWKLALVFKCLTDMIILDDFKTCLDKLRGKLVQGSHMNSMGDTNPTHSSNKEFTFTKERQGTITSQTAPNPAMAHSEGRRVSYARFFKKPLLTCLSAFAYPQDFRPPRTAHFAPASCLSTSSRPSPTRGKLFIG